jgi:hypothetical protein
MSRSSVRAAVLAAALWFAPASGGDRPGDLSPPKDDPVWSYVTPTEAGLVLKVCGTDWTLIVVADNYPYRTAELPLKKTVKPTTATLHTGPDVWQYLVPGGGPAPRPIPENGKYTKAAADGLEVTITTEARGREPDAFVTVDLSAYKVGGKERPAVKGLKLPVRGPYP